MRLGLLQSLDPTLKQTVLGFTNKNQDKTLDVLLMDCVDLYQQPTILHPMTVDVGKVGVDGDHKGVKALPRTNLDPKGSQLRREVRPGPLRPHAAYGGLEHTRGSGELVRYGGQILNFVRNNGQQTVSSKDSFNQPAGTALLHGGTTTAQEEKAASL